jgi:hypothetical protein
MEMSQGNSLCSYLKQRKMSIVFFYTIREKRRAEQVLMGGGGVSWHQWEGGGCGERV